MLRRLILLLVFALAATQAVATIGSLPCGKKAISLALPGGSELSQAADPAPGQTLPGKRLALGGKSFCLHGLATPRPAAVPGGDSACLRWTDRQSTPRGLDPSPAHPPPDSTA